MNSNQTRTFTYQELKDGVLNCIPDELNVISGISKARHSAFLSNPNLNSLEDTAVILTFIDDVAIGRITIYPTRMMIDGNIENVMGASDLHVDEAYRHDAAGTDLMLYPILDKKYRYVLYAGASPQALPIYKKLKYQILEYPRSMQLRNSRCILESKGLNGFVLKVASSIVNIPLKAISVWNKFSSIRISSKYQIEKVTTVPKWVDDIFLKDNHKYKEVHDHIWLQWNLNYHFTDFKENIQSFYTIKKNGKYIGYFMTKERYRDIAGGVLKNLVVGSIEEWGSYNEKSLSERDIYILAMNTFNKNVDIVEFATVNEKVTSAMKSFFFIKHGYAHILFMDKEKKHADAADIKNWRVRFGYADVILS